MSPNMSILGGGFLIGAGGWLAADEVRCEVDRSNCAFSFTRFRG